MKYIVIENEVDQVEVLKLYMNRLFPDLKFFGNAGSVKSGIQLLDEVKPDIVFLDIHIDGGSGFEIMEHFPEYQGALIVFTAFNDQALSAFRSNAIDFLEKPVNTMELLTAVNKAIRFLGMQQKEEKFELVLSDRKLYLAFDEMVLIRANGASTIFYLLGQNRIEEVFSGHTLKRFEEKLPSPPFYRIHDKYLLNTHYLKGIRSDQVIQLKLPAAFDLESRLERELNVSQQRIRQFREWLRLNH